jgi:hypothetical protein
VISRSSWATVYDGFVTDRTTTGDSEGRAAIVIEAIGERSDGKFRVYPEKFLPLLPGHSIT